MNSDQDKRVKTLGEDDRISSLPDDVLCHILSFIPTKLAARTAVLSTTWKRIFAASPVLELDDTLAEVTTDLSQLLFRLFVLSVLSRRNFSPIDIFRLRCTQFSYDSKNVIRWITGAICCHVQVLDVEALVIGSTPLPPVLFALGTLTTLKLSGKFVIDIPFFVNLPKLKIMHLKHVKFCDDDSAQHLFSSCPVLEELRVSDCVMDEINILNIFLPSLKKFVFQENEGPYNIELHADNLDFMHYDASQAIWGHLKSLVRADIFLEHEETLLEDFELYRLVDLICDVRFLALCGDLMEALLVSDQPLPIFRNLTRLELLPNYSIGSNILPSLLASSPCLEVLHFCAAEMDGSDADNARYYTLPQDVPICLSLHLKKIKVALFYLGEGECELIEYFLKNANVLNRVTVVSFSCSAQEIEMRNRLLKFPRKAEACELVIDLQQ